MLYAAKCYWPGVSPEQLEEVAMRARAAGRARRAGVAFLGSILFPDDELVLCLFDAPSQAVVKQTSEEAGIPCERVMTTVWFAQRRSRSC
jgi:hypothetical protein